MPHLPAPANVQSAPPRLLRPRDLTVVMRRDEDGPEIGRERVADADVSEVFAQLWCDAWLRRGAPGTALEDLELSIVPSATGSGGRCMEFQFHARDRRGRSAASREDLTVFEEAAARGSQRLVADGALKAGDAYYFEVVVDVARQAPRGAAMRLTARNRALAVASLPHRELLDHSRAVGEVDAGWMPVAVSQSALAAAERHSRAGTKSRPPIETGCVLVGPLVSCPETGELAAVVCDALELKAAEGTSFSLAYSAETWQRIQTVVRARQAASATRGHRLLGQAHGHNFRPSLKQGEGEDACAICPKQAQCRLTSVFISRDDLRWSKAVFARQPWQLAMIFGLSARGEPVQALYGLRGNRLVERGYYVIPDLQEDRFAS